MADLPVVCPYCGARLDDPLDQTVVIEHVQPSQLPIRERPEALAADEVVPGWTLDEILASEG